jgi:hypothetical protein
MQIRQEALNAQDSLSHCIHYLTVHGAEGHLREAYSRSAGQK